MSTSVPTADSFTLNRYLGKWVKKVSASPTGSKEFPNFRAARQVTPGAIGQDLHKARTFSRRFGARGDWQELEGTFESILREKFLKFGQARAYLKSNAI